MAAAAGTELCACPRGGVRRAHSTIPCDFGAKRHAGAQLENERVSNRRRHVSARTVDSLHSATQWDRHFARAFSPFTVGRKLPTHPLPRSYHVKE